MGDRTFRPVTKKARPILNERDYQAAKAVLEREMKHAHTDQVWERLESLMQEVADYESRFLQGEDEDYSELVEYAYTSVLEEQDGPTRRWSDQDD